MTCDRLLVPAVLAAMVFLGSMAPSPAAEDGAEPAPAPAADKLKDQDKTKLREIIRKQKAGEELTADEKALLEKARPRALAKDGKDPAAGRTPAQVEGLDLVNAVDAVKLQLAQSYLGRNDTDKAVDVLEKLAKATQDKTAAGFAHLALARIHRQRNDQARCDEELKKVTGPAVAGALALLAGPGGESAAKLEELLKSADEPLAKAIILRRLAALYAQNGNLDKLADLAERSGKLLSYKEAQAAQEAEAKLLQRNLGRQGAPGLAGGGQPGMKPGGANGPGAAGPGGEGRRADNAEALKKEIKELEDAGMVDEAEALKKQLKAAEERHPVKKLGAPKEGGKAMPNEGENVF